MSTKTKSLSKERVASVSGDKPRLPRTLETLQGLRTAQGLSDAQIANMLDNALSETSSNHITYVLERLMLHIGDVSRQHNMLKELGINSKSGGAQERGVFRSILRWWEKTLPESFAENLRVFAEFSVLENLMFYELKTERATGKLIGKEILFPMPSKVHEFLANEIRKNRNVNLIAKHLPKYDTGKSRTTKKTMHIKDGKDSFMWKLPEGKAWVKLNGDLIEGESVKITQGDVVSYPRDKSSHVLEKQRFVNSWISSFCKVMGWSITDYNNFRKQQNTPEQKFSSKRVLNMPKSDFWKMLDGLTSGQRYRVSRMLDFNAEKWGELPKWYDLWEGNQEKVADKLRQAAADGDTEATEKLKKEFKVKSTGKNTVDLLKDMLTGNHDDRFINNTYQSMIENMDIVANVFPVIDGSASMDCQIGGGWSHRSSRSSTDRQLSNRAVAYAMAIAFSTRNPVPGFRNTFGWFSRNFHIVGKSKYVNNAPNQYVDSGSYTKRVNEFNVLSETNTFTENYSNLRKSDPGEVSSTNMGSVITHFTNLVETGKFHVEDLPSALLFITDNENNTGISPKEALAIANKIGWSPLVIFWGLTKVPSNMMNQYKGIPNCLLVGGFNESVLSQVLRGIKSGSVDPEDEIWSIVENKRYAVITE